MVRVKHWGISNRSGLNFAWRFLGKNKHVCGF
jgi:hypothetical protein